MGKLNFKATAETVVVLSTVTLNREKISTEDIKKNFRAGFTIDEIDQIKAYDQKEKADKLVWVYHIAGTDLFAFAGYQLAQIFDSYLAAYEGDLSQLRADFTADGGLGTVVLTSAKTRDGNNVTHVEIR